MKNIYSVEQQQIKLEKALTIQNLRSTLKCTPMYFLSAEKSFDLHKQVTLTAKDSLIFEPLTLNFCKECDCAFDTDINSCTNAECLNCDIYENQYDDNFAYA